MIHQCSLCVCLLYRGKFLTPKLFLIPNCSSFKVVCEDEGVLCAYFKRISVWLVLHYGVHIWIILSEVDFWMSICLVWHISVIKINLGKTGLPQTCVALWKVKLRCKGLRDQFVICSWSPVVQARNTEEGVYSMFYYPQEGFLTFWLFLSLDCMGVIDRLCKKSDVIYQ